MTWTAVLGAIWGFLKAFPQLLDLYTKWEKAHGPDWIAVVRARDAAWDAWSSAKSSAEEEAALREMAKLINRAPS